MVRIPESELQAALSVILEREKTELQSAQMSRDAQILSLRRHLREQLQAVFSQAGIDANKINEILLRHQQEVKTILEKSKAEVEKESAAQVKNYQEEISKRRSAYELSGRKPLTITPIVIETPFSIYAAPSGMLVDSHVESWNNWAKLLYGNNNDGGYEYPSLKFFFAWKNESDYVVIFNAVSELAANGHVVINAVPGTVFGGWVNLHMRCTLKVFVGNTSYVSNASQLGIILQYLTASTWGSIFGGESELKARDINSVHPLSCPSIVANPDQLVIFEITMLAMHWINKGSVLLDFDRDHRVTCPALIVELLTSPTVTGNLGTVQPDRTL
jgi:hypothetical protein